MKLYIDDLRACPDGWEIARTITQAIRFLATGTVEEVSLDHDIAISSYGDQSTRDSQIVQRIAEETFEPVAHFLAMMRHSPLPFPIVRFHTGNIDAGMRMADIIGVKFDHELFGKIAESS